MHNGISEVFDVMPLPTPKLPVVKTETEDVDTDASEARDNLRSLVETAKIALENALNIAIQSESPRGFEVVANLLNTAADLNTKLLNTHQQQQKIKQSGQQTNQPDIVNQTTTNNVVFNGTPAELAKLLKGASL
jgi:hypothetical protein